MKNTFAPIKSHKELGITKWQWLNLIRLTLFVRDSVPPPKFDISSFNSESTLASGATYECGTTACFCGYGPLAGIKPHYGEAWGAYGARVFGAGSWFNDQGVQDLYNLLFSQDHKNSKLAAIRRGAYFLMNGFPQATSKDFLDLTEWETPKSFKNKINWKGMEQILKDNS